MIRCPHCGSSKSKVDSQPQSPDGMVRRYRMCQSCHKTFTTLEYLASSPGKGTWVRLKTDCLIPEIPAGGGDG